MTRANTPEGRAATVAEYHDRAVLSRSAAADEKLENVRQKHLASAASWEKLAASGQVELLRVRGPLDSGV